MSAVLTGMNGSNPLHFLAALGLLRIATPKHPGARLRFLADGTFRPEVSGVDEELAQLVAKDAEERVEARPWWLTYAKEGKKGTEPVADLKPPPEVFRKYLMGCLEAYRLGDDDAAAFAAAFGNSEGRDGKDKTKPTAFHFSAANMQFLKIVGLLRAAVNEAWAKRSLFDGDAGEPGSNLRWDPAADRSRALMAKDPNEDGTLVDAPLEWLAFRALPLFPTLPERGNRTVTTGVTGRGAEMRLSWCLWSEPAALGTVRSLLALDWSDPPGDRAARGVFATCGSWIRRSSQGFGNLSPASVAP